jgi:hypothetical protein
MKKRIFIVVVLTAMITSGVFAQRHWVSAEGSALGFGLRYEYIVNPYFTVGGYFHLNKPLWGLIVSEVYDNIYYNAASNVGFGAVVRWHPTAHQLFIELGLGFNSITHRFYNYTWDYYILSSTDITTKTISGLGIVPGVGWTIDVGRRGGFFISPGAKIPFTLSSDHYYFEDFLFLGLMSTTIYLGFGYAF